MSDGCCALFFPESNLPPGVRVLDPCITHFPPFPCHTPHTTTRQEDARRRRRGRPNATRTAPSLPPPSSNAPNAYIRLHLSFARKQHQHNHEVRPVPA